MGKDKGPRGWWGRVQASVIQSRERRVREDGITMEKSMKQGLKKIQERKVKNEKGRAVKQSQDIALHSHSKVLPFFFFLSWDLPEIFKVST